MVEEVDAVQLIDRVSSKERPYSRDWQAQRITS